MERTVLKIVALLTRPSLARAIGARVGLVLLAILTALALLEGSYRAYKLFRYGFVDYINLFTVGYFVPHPVYGYTLAKNFRSEDIPLGIRNSVYGRSYHMYTRFTTNSLGYRGPEFSRAKTPGTFRVVTFGGSTTMCAEVDDPDTWPALLEKRLQSDEAFLRRHGARGVEVINAAVGGWRSRENFLRLRDEVRGFAPDLLLLAFNWNDAWLGLHGMSPDASLEIRRPWWKSIKIFENLNIRYQVYRTNNERHLGSLRAGFRLDEPWVRGLARYVHAMRSIASEIGAGVVLVNLPGLASVRDGPAQVKLLAARRGVSDGRIQFFAEFSAFESIAFASIARQEGIGLIDVHGRLHELGAEKRMELFVDDMHLTLRGTRETAAVIKDTLGAR